jgi:hypothetical protein
MSRHRMQQAARTIFGLALGASLLSCGKAHSDKVELLPAESAALQRYYQEGQEPIPGAEALAALRSDRARQRARAAATLRALLATALADERSGVAPWRASPFWGNAHVRVALMRRFVDAGYPEPYRFYLSLLEIEGSQLGGSTFGKPVAEHFADEILEMLEPADPDLQAIAKRAEPAERVRALREWLRARAG